jgi:hypothetical protein
MLSFMNGKIDGKAPQQVAVKGEYEAVAEKLGGDAWICGRATMQQHFAEDESFVSASNTPAGPQPVHVARRADSYAISVDTVMENAYSNSLRPDGRKSTLTFGLSKSDILIFSLCPVAEG